MVSASTRCGLTAAKPLLRIVDLMSNRFLAPMASQSMDSSSTHANSQIPPFLTKTYDMVDDPSTDDIVSWSSSNLSFIVWNQSDFARDLLPKYFKHNNFSSFVRQLNTYGFRKSDPDRWEFTNEGFVRGKRHLLSSIHRRKPSSTHSHSQPHGQHSANECVEFGNFPVDEEFERLKRDKNVLMMELVRLRQQQQATERDLQSLGSRLQAMEQRQHQMMTFLAKAMQNPGFLAQLVQQNENSILLEAAIKKRRLPSQEEDIGSEESNISDGQIVKYQESSSDVARFVLMQLLNSDTASKTDLFSNSLEGSLKELTYSPAEQLDGDKSGHSSMVSLAETNPSTIVPDPLVDDLSGQSHTELPDSPLEFPETEEIRNFVSRDMDDAGTLKTKPDDVRKTTETKMESLVLDLNLNNTAKVSSDNETNTREGTGPAVSNVNDRFWQQFLTESADGSADADTEGSTILQCNAKMYFKFLH